MSAARQPTINPHLDDLKAPALERADGRLLRCLAHQPPLVQEEDVAARGPRAGEVERDRLGQDRRLRYKDFPPLEHLRQSVLLCGLVAHAWGNVDNVRVRKVVACYFIIDYGRRRTDVVRVLLTIDTWGLLGTA